MGSIQVRDRKIIETSISDPDFPFLISFPRSGSHFLRMIMELYFRKPALVRIFYYKNANTFTCYHSHDHQLDIQRRNIIYLYRNPTDTIYSHLAYCGEPLDDISRLQYWSRMYGQHLSKWLLEEDFTCKKTVVTLEGVTGNLNREFKKICDHFSMPFIKEKLDRAVAKVTPVEVKHKTYHDQRVVNLSHEYEAKRQIFKEKNDKLIRETVCSQNSLLAKISPKILGLQ